MLHQDLIRYLAKASKWKRLPDARMQADCAASQQAHLTWRPDMEDFVTDMLRDLVLQSLRHDLTEEAHTGLETISSVEEIQELRNTACILHLQPTGQLGEMAVNRREAVIDAEVNKIIEKLGGITKSSNLVPNGMNATSMVPKMLPEVQKPPFSFPTIRAADGVVSLYFMVDMLGQDTVNQLVRGTQFESAACIAVKGTDSSMTLQKRLLRLQFFLAGP